MTPVDDKVFYTFEEFMGLASIGYKRKVTQLIKEGLLKPVIRQGLGKAYWFTDSDVANYKRVYGPGDKSMELRLMELEDAFLALDEKLNKFTESLK